MLRKFIVISVVLALFTAGCGKSVGVGSRGRGGGDNGGGAGPGPGTNPGTNPGDPGTPPGGPVTPPGGPVTPPGGPITPPVGPVTPPGTPPTNPDPTLKPCSALNRLHWNFVQPTPIETRKVDLLFVVDTSLSLATKRSKIASQIPAFLSQLKPGTDLKIAVMLGHGGASRHSGRLNSGLGSPEVIDALNLPVAEVERLLENNLKHVTMDSDFANGEALLYSLSRSLESDRVTEIQGQGFYRTDAALSIVLVTDENDVCYLPQDHGYKAFPDYAPDLGKFEEKAFTKYCSAPSRFAEYYDYVFDKVHRFKGKFPTTLGAIAYTDPATVPKGALSEEAIGHGIIEFVQKDPSGALMNIADSSFEPGLAKLGSVVSQRQDQLETHFVLTKTTPLDASSIITTVDTAPVTSTYDPLTWTVEIPLSSAGAAGSLVEVSACPQLAPKSRF